MSAPAHAAVRSILTQAVECLASASMTAYLLADDSRVTAEQRAGVEAGDMAVLDDPEYVAALDRNRRLHELADDARKVMEEWA